MDCQTSKEYISQFLDNELPQELLQPLFRHLADCGECRTFFVHTKSIHDSVKKLEYVPVPESLDQKFAVLGMEEKKVSVLFKNNFVSIPTAILSVIFAFMISILIFFSLDASTSPSAFSSINQQALGAFSYSMMQQPIHLQ
ncbi:MAG: zf-HC2 domain-containing protein [Bacteroidota bacterium]|nr:zf-HC2 domain-containing protein [Bacteroidota bacterium]